MKRIAILPPIVAFALLLGGCKPSNGCSPSPVEDAPDAKGATPSKSTLVISNETDQSTVVYIAFGADSVVLPGAWSFCAETAALSCNFSIAKHSVQTMPLEGGYLNATVSFGSPVGCNTTKAELNLNNPAWYDTSDVSLVDGYDDKIEIEVVEADGLRRLGPPAGASGNEAVYGLFPLGCDICVARQSPPCGMTPGKSGCKAGSQYAPDVPCQYQGEVKGGGGAYRVSLLP